MQSALSFIKNKIKGESSDQITKQIMQNHCQHDNRLDGDSDIKMTDTLQRLAEHHLSSAGSDTDESPCKSHSTPHGPFALYEK